MIILASLSGIQDFRFDLRESGGGQAGSPRDRSFRIRLIAERDPLGRRFDELQLGRDERSPLPKRNRCLLARGFAPLSKADYEALRPKTEELGVPARAPEPWRLPRGPVSPARGKPPPPPPEAGSGSLARPAVP